VVGVVFGLTLPFSVYLLANFFRTIPASTLEAAQIDGASAWRIFAKIVLPLSGAPVATLVVVNLLWVWNELLLALVFLQSDSKKTLMVGITGFQSRYSLDIPPSWPDSPSPHFPWWWPTCSDSAISSRA
jgi:ABC-type glycerol-3-phosphate transport system permease component